MIPLNNVRGFVVSFFINELVLQVLALKTDTGRERFPGGIPFAFTPQVGSWEDYLPMIWPDPPDVLEWPPSRNLFGRELKTIAYRFSGDVPPSSLRVPQP